MIPEESTLVQITGMVVPLKISQNVILAFPHDYVVLCPSHGNRLISCLIHIDLAPVVDQQGRDLQFFGILLLHCSNVSVSETWYYWLVFTMRKEIVYHVALLETHRHTERRAGTSSEVGESLTYYDGCGCLMTGPRQTVLLG
jgi:hypothetical protein